MSVGYTLSFFDHQTQDWDTFRCKINQWFIANDIVDAKDAAGIKRRAILLSTLSDGTFKLAVDLAQPKDLQQVPYEDIIELLNRHFTVKRCGFSERYRFYAASQLSSESFTQWAARLRGLTAHCSFSNLEEALRDRFVMGMLQGPEREKLFAQDLSGLTLSKAIDLAESIRCARAGAATTVCSASSARLQEQLFKVTSQTGESVDPDHEPCATCGRTNHVTSKCRFSKLKCTKCNMKGHLRKMCKKVKFVTTGANVSEGDGDDGELFYFHIRSEHGEPMTDEVLVLGKKIKFEFDCGAGITAISDVTYRKYFSDVPLSRVTKKLSSYTGVLMKCLGVIRLPMTYAGSTHSMEVYVVCGGGPPILGRNFMSKFNLGLSPINYCDSNNDIVMRELEALYPEVFCDKLGLFKKYEVKIQLKKDAKPVFFKARPLAFALKDRVGKELDRLVGLDVLEPVEHSDYASPIVPVLKRNGSIRICADYSVSINKQLVINQYPLPTIHELFTKLHSGQQFSKLDLSMAYTQFKLDARSQNYTCINTHRGLFKYKRLVFGLASAPAIFQRAMEELLAGMDGVLCLLDDILITGPDRTVHLQRVHDVLKRLQDVGLVLQKEKCDFFKDRISYLGYEIDRNGLHKSPDKVKAVMEAPNPVTVGQLQSFLGLVNYYRNFIPNASSILSPLYELLKKGVKFNWDTKHSKAFTKVKHCLASDQVLAHFNPDFKIILTVDASPSGLGAILSQIESDGNERPISFASRTLSQAEKNYSQIQKEATAIIFGMRRFHQYLYARSVPFILRTDHKPLLSIFGPHKGIPEVSANRLQRYAIFLSSYNYNIEFVRSGDNSADFLSRASLPADTADQCAEESLCAVDRATYINFVIEGGFPVTLNDLRTEIRRDATLEAVIKYVLNGWPRKVMDAEIAPYFNCRMQLAYENGCLMRGHKVVLPRALRSKVLAELHQSHLGIVKTKAEARSRFWFPGIDKAIEDMIGTCEVCIQLRPTPARAPLAPWKYPQQPFYRIHMDFLGPFHSNVFLVVVDAYTKWVEVFTMGSNAGTAAVIDSLCEFMSRFGLPHTIVSDNGTAFTSQEFSNFCALNDIAHVTSPAYHPASNGQAESYVKVVKKGIRSCLLGSKNASNYKSRLGKFLFDYRNSIHSTTGFSPAQLVFGRKLRSRLDLLNPLSPPSSTDLVVNVENKQSLQSKQYNGQNRKPFCTGDSVLYKKFLENNKFSWRKGTVIKRTGKVTYLVEDAEIPGLIRKKHIDQLNIFKGLSCQPDTTWSCEIGLEDLTCSVADASHVGSPGISSSTVGEEGPPVASERDEFYDAQTEQANASVHMELRDIPRVDYKKYY